MELAEVADELYALLPEEFTATRNERAKAARAAGDKELVQQIRGLPKPSKDAWVVNMLSRRRAEDIARVLELGATFREAQQDADRDELRELNRQRNQLVGALAKQARRLAGELGHDLSETTVTDVEQTLRAAITDSAAATAVRSGWLTRTLSATGLEPVDLSGSVALPEMIGPLSGTAESKAASRRGNDKKSGARKSVQQKKHSRAEAERKDAERQKAARREAEHAEREAERLSADGLEAERRIEDTAARRDRLTGELDDLRDRIRDVERDIETVERDLRSAEQERKRIRRDETEALSKAERARERAEQPPEN
ncbi:hypothetical protein LWF01_07470 [Saxibacter everestensis]|uniref:Transposase n=1 Tax=Saxibacter everestensis TaxID=2909229 RepID=A0ABY8QZF1_9MICO|nr:hypothetical protein LWF01_07470 [Brevibacteriaceae bacterium ZFBP1038]